MAQRARQLPAIAAQTVAKEKATDWASEAAEFARLQPRTTAAWLPSLPGPITAALQVSNFRALCRGNIKTTGVVFLAGIAKAVI